jgi:RimJ/RimL family protein N-acetyltransferase
MTSPAFEILPRVFQGRTIRLEPLTTDHATDLFATADPTCFRYHGTALEAFTDYIRAALAHTARHPFAAIHLAQGRAIGSTSFFEVRAAGRGLEIGFTWIATPLRSTAVNPEMKLLMMRHAFEDLGALRVQLKCDSRNAQSRRAIEKLGAKQEGILRRHAIMPDGYLRDSVVYSVIDDEWPAVRAGLEARCRV